MREIFYKSLSILALTLVLTSSAAYAQPVIDTLLFEDFNNCSASAPTGWTDTIVEGPIGWVYNKNGQAGGSLNGTCAMVFDDFFAAPNPPNWAYVTTSNFDATGLNNVQLVFDYNMTETQNSGGNVPPIAAFFRIYVWNGYKWMEIYEEDDDKPSASNFGFFTRTLDLMPYVNPDMRLRFEYEDNGWSDGVSVDNILVRGEIPFQYDARVLRGYDTVEYTQIPYAQTPHNVKAIGENYGTDPLTGVVITTTISEPLSGTVLTESSAPMNLNPGETFEFQWPGGGFVHPFPGTWIIQHSITMNEPDAWMGNNSVVPWRQGFSNDIYARDDSNYVNGIGFGGAPGELAQIFHNRYETILTNIQFQLGNTATQAYPTVGDPFQVKVYKCVNNVPDSLVYESPIYKVQGSAAIWYDIPIAEGGIILQPDTYAIALAQVGNNNISLAFSNTLFFKRRILFNAGGAWTPVEFANFRIAYSLRGQFGCMRLNPGKDSTICSDQSYMLGGNPTASGVSGPVTYSWAPAADLDDPTSANPLFTPSDTGEFVFTVTASDTAGCVQSSTVTVRVNPAPQAGIAGLQTDYCIYDDPDTIDIQPAGGEVSGPGVVVIDSTRCLDQIGGSGGFLETTFSTNNGQSGNMFDIVAKKKIAIVDFDINVDGGTWNVEVYTKAGSHVGSETNASAWTLVATTTVAGAGLDNPTPLELQNMSVTIDAGATQAFYVTVTNGTGMNYFNGSAVGNVFAEDDAIQFLEGTGNAYPFGAVFQPRVWSGNIYYANPICGSAVPGNTLFDPALAGLGEHQIVYCYTNDFGCTACDTFTVNVHPRPDATINPAGPVCLNETIMMTAVTPFGTWSGNGIVDPAAGTFSGAAAGVGDHTVYYDVIDARGCYNRDSIVVTVNDIPTVDAGADMTVCAGSAVQIGGNPTATAGVSNNGFIDNYSWSPATGLSSSVDPNPMASPAATTTYTVTVTDNNGCSASDEMTVEVREAPTADAGDNVVSCDGQPVYIGGSPSASGGTPPYTYSWSPAASLDDATLASPLANPSVTTSYTLTVTDANGCTDMDQVIVSVKPSPVADAGNDVTVCSDVSISLGGAPTGNGGTAPYTYSWSPADGLNSTAVANPSFSYNNTNANPITKTYSVTVTDASGCTSTDVVNVIVRPAVFVDAGADDEICVGNATKIGGLAPATNGIPPYSYSWSPTVGLITPNMANPTVTPTSSTIYTLTVTDGVGCVGEDMVEVIVNPLPVVDAGADQTICRGSTVIIGGQPTADGGKAPYDYSWSPYIGLNDETLPNPLAGPNSETNFTVTVTDSKGCVGSDAMTVFVNETPVAHAGVDKEICIGESIMIGAAPAASNGVGPYQYTWSPLQTLDDEQVENPIASPTVTTRYVLTVTDQNNCTDSDSMIVTVNPLPDVSIVGLATDFCYDDSIQMLMGDPAGGVFIGNGVFGSTFVPAAAGVGKHDIKYIYTDEKGCTDSTFQIVDVHPLPVIDAGPDKFVYLSKNTVLDATADGDYSYAWDPTTSLDDPLALNPNVIGLTQTTTFQVTATNQWGCTNSDVVTVVVDVNLPINPPNLFTPNGDGVNDTWFIEELAFFPNNNLKVYNRYGQLVYEADNVGQNAWDGSDLPEGSYYWVLTLNIQGNNVHRGTVTIKR